MRRLNEAIAEFGGTARECVSEGRSVEAMLLLCGCRAVHASSAELQAVVRLSGFSSEGADRVLRLRERLLELRRAGLESPQAVLCMAALMRRGVSSAAVVAAASAPATAQSSISSSSSSSVASTAASAVNVGSSNASSAAAAAFHREDSGSSRRAVSIRLNLPSGMKRERSEPSSAAASPGPIPKRLSTHSLPDLLGARDGSATASRGAVLSFANLVANAGLRDRELAEGANLSNFPHRSNHNHHDVADDAQADADMYDEKYEDVNGEDDGGGGGRGEEGDDGGGGGRDELDEHEFHEGGGGARVHWFQVGGRRREREYDEGDGDDIDDEEEDDDDEFAMGGTPFGEMVHDGGGGTGAALNGAWNMFMDGSSSFSSDDDGTKRRRV